MPFERMRESILHVLPIYNCARRGATRNKFHTVINLHHNHVTKGTSAWQTTELHAKMKVHSSRSERAGPKWGNWGPGYMEPAAETMVAGLRLLLDGESMASTIARLEADLLLIGRLQCSPATRAVASNRLQHMITANVRSCSRTRDHLVSMEEQARQQKIIEKRRNALRKLQPDHAQPGQKRKAADISEDTSH